MLDASEKTNLRFSFRWHSIGGIDLGLERAGWKCSWQVENEPYCVKVLEKHWPDIPKFGDITKLTGEELSPVDMIAGGFPCQDLSTAGKRKGIDGERSGLFFDLMRIVRVVRPRIILLENVPGLLSRGMGRVLGEVAESGYDAEWRVLDAHGFGVPQRRQRIFIIGYPGTAAPLRALFDEGHTAMVQGGVRAKNLRASRQFSPPLRAESVKHGNLPIIIEPCGDSSSCLYGTGMRTTDGFSRRMDVSRYRGLGNSVSPPVAEYLGERIREAFF